MALLLNWRVWAVSVLVALIPLGYMKGRSDGTKLERASVASAVQAANQEARRMEQLRQRNVDDAAKAAAAREAGIRASAASAARESAGLRDDLRAARDYAKESSAAAERTATLATDLLGRCESRYLGMAEAAARADSYARQLIEAWPKP